MNVRTIVLVLCLVMMGGAAMAIEKSPSVRRDGPRNAPLTPEEEFFQTPKGRSAKRFLDFIEKGDLEAARREYEWAQKQFGIEPPQSSQPSPRTYQDPRGPMQLPSELR